MRLTLAGEHLWAAMHADIGRYDRTALHGFSTGECLDLFRLLDGLRDSLGRIAGAEQDDPPLP